MQLIARDKDSICIASQASKGKNYTCPECKALVRLRSGPHKQAHFYHLSVPKECRQHQKSQEHIHLQLLLLERLKQEEAAMEWRFPEIGRIADVAWLNQKYIIEVQCSPITLKEVREREEDYQRIGFQVLWILHEKCFNKKKLSAAEALLRLSPSYFTNVNDKGRGIIYDQFEVIQNNRRLFKGPPLPISFPTLSPMTSPISKEDPLMIRLRKKRWKFFIQGDVLDRFEKEESLWGKSSMSLTENRLLKTDPLTEPLSRWKVFICYYHYLMDHLISRFK